MKKYKLVSFLLVAFVMGNAQLKTVTDNPNQIRPVTKPGANLPSKNIVYDFSDVKICLDAFNMPTQPLPPLPPSHQGPEYKIESNGNISRAGVKRQPLVGFTDKMWAPGSVISVYLSNKASEYVRGKVIQYARYWEQYANIRFDFIDNYNLANIKVTFDQNGESWSWLGRTVLINPIFTNTMNFGWLKDNSAEFIFRSVVLHEFGHALGLGHEHQSPASPLNFVKSYTYEYFRQKNNWSSAMVDEQVINKYNKSNTNYSAYDRYSIMHYPIPGRLLQGEQPAEAINTELSAKDKQYIGLWYPFPPTPSNAVGNLFTGDDCDNIYFTVEYNVVPADKVEFRLEFGQTDGNMVSWWKKIGIPLVNNRESVLEIQNHSLIASENKSIAEIQISLADIDINKGINFAKAKMLGVHTPLGFKWNVLPALKGGCRVRLTWRKDRCA